MIDHVSIAVSDLARSAAFYDAVLAPLGLTSSSTRAGLPSASARNIPSSG